MNAYQLSHQERGKKKKKKATGTFLVGWAFPLLLHLDSRGFLQELGITVGEWGLFYKSPTPATRMYFLDFDS